MNTRLLSFLLALSVMSAFAYVACRKDRPPDAVREPAKVDNTTPPQNPQSDQIEHASNERASPAEPAKEKMEDSTRPALGGGYLRTPTPRIVLRRRTDGYIVALVDNLAYGMAKPKDNMVINDSLASDSLKSEAVIVLMQVYSGNLDEVDIARQLQEYRDWVRKHPH